MPDSIHKKDFNERLKQLLNDWLWASFHGSMAEDCSTDLVGFGGCKIKNLAEEEIDNCHYRITTKNKHTFFLKCKYDWDANSISEYEIIGAEIPIVDEWLNAYEAACNAA